MWGVGLIKELNGTCPWLAFLSDRRLSDMRGQAF